MMTSAAFRTSAKIAVSLLLLQPCLVTQSYCDEWSIDRIYNAIKAREDSIRSIHATLKVEEGATPEFTKFLDEKDRSASEFAKASGVTPPIDNVPRPSVDAPQTTTIEYWRDANGRERFDRRSIDNKEYQTVFTGKVWKTYDPSHKNGHIFDNTDVEKIGHFLTTDIDISPTGAFPIKSRLLTRTLTEAKAIGQLVTPATKDVNRKDSEVVLLLRLKTSNPSLGQGFYDQTTLWFDKSLGMAPVRIEICSVYKQADKFVDVPAALLTTGVWSDFSEKSEGIWLPSTYKSVLFQSVAFPTHQLPADTTQWKPSDIRYDKYPTSYRTTSATRIDLNTDIDADRFDIKFPDGVVVLNTINDKVYHVGNQVPNFIDVQPTIPAKGLTTRSRIIFIIASIVIASIAVLLVWLKRSPT